MTFISLKSFKWSVQRVPHLFSNGNRALEAPFFSDLKSFKVAEGSQNSHFLPTLST